MIPPPQSLHMYWLLAGEAFINLLAVAQRSILALLGIVIGTASVIAMVNVGHNAETESIRQFKAMGTDLIVVRAFTGENPPPPLSAIEAIPQSFSTIREVAPLSITGITLRQRERIPATLVGATATLQSVARLKLAEGRFLSPYDNKQIYAVIGASLSQSKKLSPSPLRPGDRLRIGSYLFTIVGVLAQTTHNPLLPFDVNEGIFIPLDAIPRVVPKQQNSTIMVSVAKNNDPIQAADLLKNHLSALYKGVPVQIQSARQLLEGMQKQAQIMSILLAATGGISLFVGGVGVMNVMLMNVAERRREIGLRMALGARRRHIQSMFLIEAVLLSLTGGLTGTILGILAAYAYALYAGWIFSSSSLALPLGTIISLGVGIFFGAYPATIAARQDPIESLRSE